jgi:hypothetical protein
MFFGFRVLKGDNGSMYVRRPVLNGQDIADHYKAQGCTPLVSPDDMHVTVVHSKAPVDWGSIHPHGGNLTVNASDDRQHQTFDKGATVLPISSDALDQRHQQLLAAGAKSSYPTYKPHVTLSYGGKGFDKAKPYAGPVNLGPEQHSAVNSDWAPKLTKADKPMPGVKPGAKPAAPKPGGKPAPYVHPYRDEQGSFTTKAKDATFKGTGTTRQAHDANVKAGEDAGFKVDEDHNTVTVMSKKRLGQQHRLYIDHAQNAFQHTITYPPAQGAPKPPTVNNGAPQPQQSGGSRVFKGTMQQLPQHMQTWG